MKKLKTIGMQAIIGILPILYLFSIWNKLPDQVPTHYNAQFEADQFGSKFDLLGILVFLFVIIIGVSLLLLNLNKIDPKQRYEGNHPLLVKITWSLTIFISLISFYIIYEAEHYPKTAGDTLSQKYLLALVALLFVVLGNFMNAIKPNYFVGIRTPWTLDDEENWRQTHQLGSKIWFFGGLFMFFLVLLLPQEYLGYITVICLTPLAGIPIFYSYYLFRQKQNKSKIG